MKGDRQAMDRNRITVDKKYVHKFRDENVFLSDLRRVLPVKIPSSLFENRIPELVTEEEYNHLKQRYVKNAATTESPEEMAWNDVYMLRSLREIYRLHDDEYEVLVATRKSQWERETIESLYAPESGPAGGYHVLKDGILEPYDNFLLHSCHLWDHFLFSEERARLSTILEKVPEIEKRDVFLANMYVDVTHPFFFEHPNEHVPAIMLIESVRQFLLACSHKYGKVPFEETQIIVNYMNSQFLQYININYPILFRSTTEELKINRQGQWQYQKVRTEVFQAGRVMSIFTFDGNCIGSHLFERIRRGQIAELKQSRFVPITMSEYRLIVVQDRSGKPEMATLLNISLTGLAIKIEKERFTEGSGIVEISLSYRGQDSIKGEYAVIWTRESGDYVILGLKNEGMDAESRKTLHEFICRDCMVLQDRASG